MAKIEYNSENCMLCMCPSCPVQAMSKCTMEKRPKWLEMQKETNEMMSQKMGARGGMSMPAQEQEMPTMEKEQMGMEMEMLKPEEMMGLYCSSEVGKATCTDLDGARQCSCPSCMVWMRNGLTQYKYCIEGDADQRG